MNSRSRIVTLGGGTGGPSVIRSLVLAGFSDISAISASTDSGGKTGIIRSDERDRVIAVSDLLRTLFSLISPSQNQVNSVSAFTDLTDFTDGRNRNLGYTIYYALLEKYHNDFLKVQDHLERLLNIRFHGTAIPITLEPAHIRFSTASGTEYIGEHELDRQSMSTNTITKIWLDPQTTATPQAISAITNATHIIFCPGSLYGSVMVNFLPQGIKEAFKKSRAKIILISNLVSDRNQTHNFTPSDFFRVFSQYSNLSRPFDFLISPNISQSEFESQYPDISQNYAHEHSHFLGWTASQLSPLSAKGVRIITSDIFSVTPQLNRLRHDPNKLSQVLQKLIQTIK
jgi:uncharacterized cofD-like protein